MSSPSPAAAAPRSAALLGLVVLGGALGVVVRAALLLPLDDPAALSWATAAINVFGSLLLGVVVGWLGVRHPHARAFLGTGVLGGFTTYSALAVQTAEMAATEPWTAGAVAATSVAIGLVGAVVGLFIGRRIADVPGEVEPPESAE